jgi:hypothetical protein
MFPGKEHACFLLVHVICMFWACCVPEHKELSFSFVLLLHLNLKRNISKKRKGIIVY